MLLINSVNRLSNLIGRYTSPQSGHILSFLTQTIVEMAKVSLISELRLSRIASRVERKGSKADPRDQKKGCRKGCKKRLRIILTDVN